MTTADVVAAVERAVRAGAALVQPPETMPWGQTVAYVHDNNGFLVELCTPMGVPQPSAP
ncbi:VOC family protein [Alicycliphilus sp. T452]